MIEIFVKASKGALMTSYETSRLFGVSVLTFATLFFSSQLALAQFSQQGPKLVGTFAVGDPEQGFSVALSADGNTAIVGGPWDNSQAGAAWVYTLSGGVWTQQGSKLVPTDPVGPSQYGGSVALSADGNTAIVGGALDNSGTGAAWVFTRSGGLWAQQGSKLVGIGTIGGDYQGISVALSADGNTAIVGAPRDTFGTGAAWVYTRSDGVWSQQGSKLVGTGAAGPAKQGTSVALSADGNTAVVGGPYDNLAGPLSVGAAWAFVRNGGVWTEQGNKLVGTGATGNAAQGTSVAISGDGYTALLGGPWDNTAAGTFLGYGAAWVFTQPALQVKPNSNITASGTHGGPFSPSSFKYTLSASKDSVSYAITAPSWLTVSSKSGTLSTSPKPITFTINSSAHSLAPNTYAGSVSLHNTVSGAGDTSLVAT
jgi:hypothetical protein